MTDRLSGFVVILEQDIREDDAEATIMALRRIKGVLKVEPHTSDVGDQIAKARAMDEMEKRIWKALHPE